MRKEDVASGEQTKIGAYSDSGVYTAFRNWVEDQNGGRAYSNVGDALERAMLEYMDDNTLHETVDEIDDQTTRNEALLRQVLDRLDGDDAQKVKGQITDSATTDTGVPKGKNPGDRKKRELHVIRALYLSDGADMWHEEPIREAIQEVAGVSSPQTVNDYLEAIVNSRAFMSSRQANTWRMDREAVEAMLREHEIEVPA